MGGGTNGSRVAGGALGFTAATAGSAHAQSGSSGFVDAARSLTEAFGGPLPMILYGMGAAAVVAAIVFALITRPNTRSPRQEPAVRQGGPGAYDVGRDDGSYEPRGDVAGGGPQDYGAGRGEPGGYGAAPRSEFGGAGGYGAQEPPRPITEPPTHGGFGGTHIDDRESTAPGGQRGSAPGYAYAELEFLAPAELGRVYVTRQVTFIGRHSDDHVQVEDITVSRRHALLSRRPDGVFNIRNNTAERAQSNPVYVNGVERNNWALSDGDEVALGGARFRFRLLAGAPN